MELGLAAHARERPDKPALIVGERSLSYRELHERTNRLAHLFRRLGVGAGDRVAVMVANGAEYFEAMHACGRIGATMVPVNFHFKREEVAYLLEDSEAKAFVAGTEFLPEVREAAGARCAIVGVGDAPGTIAYEPALAGEPATDPPGAILRHGFNVMIYTSGTTGRPKGVVHPRMDPEIAEQSQSMMAAMWGFGTDDVHLVVGPLYHTAPGGYGFLHLFIGATVVIQRRFDAEEALALVAKHRVTTTHMVPVNFIRILALPAAVRRHDLSSLRRVLHAAAPCPEEVKWKIMDVFPRDSVWEYYGATEGAATVISPDEWRRRPGSVGKPWPGLEVKILDEEGRDLPRGSVGQIYVSTMGGRGFEYHKAPEKTRAAYRGSFFTVGDMGHLDADGYLFISDRKIDMVISGGVNIYPREIEEVLHRHPVVVDAAVFGVPDEQWGEAIKAVVELREGAGTDAAALASFCRQHLADYKCPRSFDLVHELPRDPNGKVLKRNLRDPYWAGRTKRV